MLLEEETRPAEAGWVALSRDCGLDPIPPLQVTLGGSGGGLHQQTSSFLSSSEEKVAERFLGLK